MCDLGPRMSTVTPRPWISTHPALNTVTCQSVRETDGTGRLLRSRRQGHPQHTGIAGREGPARPPLPRVVTASCGWRAWALAPRGRGGTRTRAGSWQRAPTVLWVPHARVTAVISPSPCDPGQRQRFEHPFHG
uniref:Uncharacterized protein n=1 Tax=Molossus molossus TaxID=27622 RepID=A0A7J8EDZ6_MOLMO|nr:hypothetical protein HJG59_008808 [Molossus molossus]